MADSGKSLDNNTDERDRTLLQKSVETGALVTTWVALGLYLEIFGPTLIDLKLVLGTTYEDVAFAVSARSFGLFPGCILGGFLVDKFERYSHLMLALCLDVAGAATIAIPWCPGIDYLWALCFVGGMMESIINVAGQRLVLRIWQEKSAGQIHLLHMGYGVGSFIIPLYANPYLAIQQDSSHNGTTGLNVTTGMNFTTTTTSNMPVLYERESRIEYPYAISGSLVVCLSLIFFFYQIKEIMHWKRVRARHKKDNTTSSTAVKEPDTMSDRFKSFLRMINPATCADGDLFYGLQIFGLALFHFANCNGGERMISDFIRSYSIDQLDFSSDDASLINTAFWICFTVGRFVFFLLSNFISIRIVFMIETVMITVISVLLNIFATNNKLAYWGLMLPLGFFLAPLYPTGIGWTDFHVEMSGVAVGMSVLGAAVGGIIHMRLVGYLYDHVSYRAFLYQILGYAIFALLVATALNTIGVRHGSRFDKKKSKEDNNQTEAAKSTENEITRL